VNTKEKILRHIETKQSSTGKELTELLGISRQALNKHLKELIENGRVVKDGTTKGAVYRPATAKGGVEPARRFIKAYLLEGLEEDKVFQEQATLLNLKSRLGKPAWDTAYYAFTEMLNNAIEHSQSEQCSVNTSVDQYRFNFTIRDFGIGIFYSVFSKFDLPNENAAIGELIKGKTTTMRERHAGEGVFFTSKAGDSVSFRSHRTNLTFDNLRRDVFVEEKRFIKGTQVDFSMSRHSKRRLDKLFQEFAPEEFEYRFDKTRVQVKLFKKDCISRSEAKRLLVGLDNFREITLDFKGVKSMGQGFADEVFRVFRNAYPDILIETENLSHSLEPIIHHVVDNKIK
jgi:biotin operon repressor/anti-sigma regulatory factor (Ser/Thr protein kinase)